MLGHKKTLESISKYFQVLLEQFSSTSNFSPILGHFWPISKGFGLFLLLYLVLYYNFGIPELLFKYFTCLKRSSALQVPLFGPILGIFWPISMDFGYFLRVKKSCKNSKKSRTNFFGFFWFSMAQTLKNNVLCS